MTKTRCFSTNKYDKDQVLLDKSVASFYPDEGGIGHR